MREVFGYTRPGKRRNSQVIAPHTFYAKQSKEALMKEQENRGSEIEQTHKQSQEGSL